MNCSRDSKNTHKQAQPDLTMRDVLVSVIIPVFNAEKYVAACIESVLGQTWGNIELIVIDDHSVDQSWQISNTFQSSRVRVLRNSGKGSSSARNLGIARANGEYLQFLDADDLLNPQKIEMQLGRLSDAPQNSVATCAWGRFRDDIGEASFKEERVWRDYPEAWKWLQDSWEGGGMMQTACWLIPSSIVEVTGPWDENLPSNPNDDGEFFSRILLNCGGVVFCDLQGVYYRSSVQTSLSRMVSPQAVMSAYLTLEKYEKFIERSGLHEQFRRALRLNYLNFMYRYHSLAGDLNERAWTNAVRLGAGRAAEVGGVRFREWSRFLGFRNALKLRTTLEKFRSLSPPAIRG